jgi:spore coat protein U-like protein
MTGDAHPRGLPWRATRTALAAAVFFLAAVSARALLGSCSFSVVTGVSFGNYDPLNATPLDQTGTIVFACTGLIPLQTVTVDLSTGSSGSYAVRTMVRGAGTLNYNLFLDPTRTAIWGNGMPGTVHFGPVLLVNGVNETLTIYGRIPAQQTSPVGNYTDTVVATINF